jgi:hypothetical protein
LKVQQLEPLLRNKDAAVRRSAWRAVRAGEVAVPAATFRQAVEDEDEAVRAVALSAAAWSRQAWLLDHLRAAAARPAPQKPEGLVMLGLLGTPVDVPLIQRIATNAALGPGRFDAVAAYGHPEVVPALLVAMRDKDVASAAAAGDAFTRITGIDVASGRRATVPPADGHEPDEFEKEFLEEVMLPDAQAATERWQKVKGAFTAGTRWSRGVHLSETAGAADLATLDMQARWQARVRARYAGSWSGRYFEVEKFPMAG